MSLRRTMLFLTAGALASGGTLAAAPAAHATSDPLTYACTLALGTTSLGSTDMSVVTDTDLPAVMHVGDSLPVGLTSQVTVPWSAVSLAYTLGARSASGTASAAGTTTGPGGYNNPTTTNLAVPSTPLVDSTPVTVNSSGVGDPFAPATPGVYTITAGDFTSNLSFFDATGKDILGSPVTATCAAPTGVSTVVDTVTVKAKTTTSLALARASAAYGQRVPATATVSTNAGPANGSVQFTAGGQTVTVPVSAGKATALLPVLHAGSHPVTATFKPSNNLYDASSATKSLAVTKAATRTRAAMTVARLHRVAKARVGVTSAAGTPTGRITVVLKKGAHRVVRKVVRLHSGRAFVRLKRLAAKGRYTLTVTYGGTHDLAGSKVVKRFRVRH